MTENEKRKVYRTKIKALKMKPYKLHFKRQPTAFIQSTASLSQQEDSTILNHKIIKVYNNTTRREAEAAIETESQHKDEWKMSLK